MDTKRPHRHSDASNCLSAICGKTSTTLETLNADVFRLIALELSKDRRLKALATCSRTLRRLASPVLFYRCHLGAERFPPPAIRPFARYFRLPGDILSEEYSRCLSEILDSFPFLTAVIFEDGGCVPWELLKPCLARPRILSLTFEGLTSLPDTEPYPEEELSSIPTNLTNFEFITPVWRDISVGPAILRNRYDYKKVLSREATNLAALVKRINGSVERLAIPVESVPLHTMADMSWPHLRELAFCGVYRTTSEVEQLPVFLSSLPNMRKLSIQVQPSVEPELRAPILGDHPAPSKVLCGLRSLTVSYPNPDDVIFSVDTTCLTHLSLRDFPRYYHKLFGRRFGRSWGSPLLSPEECLSILQRMALPQLTSLEIVYKAETAGSDDALLTYVASKLPKLTHLEIHRYRVDRKEVVAHISIAKILAEAKSLERVYLYLDMHDDPGLYRSNDDELFKVWFPTFKKRGTQILKIMQVCPQLEFVALLYFGQRSPFWAEFHPKRCAMPRFLVDLRQKPDSQLLPFRW